MSAHSAEYGQGSYLAAPSLRDLRSTTGELNFRQPLAIYLINSLTGFGASVIRYLALSSEVAQSLIMIKNLGA